MIVEINLENKDQCNDCPMLTLDYDYPHECSLGYWEDGWRIRRDKDSIYERPQICKDNHGI
jgi:hypothetical protein